MTLAPLSSLTGRYLLVGRGYEVLKRWKVSRGPVFNQRILDPDPSLESLRSAGPDAVVPIPQSPRRARALGGSPVEALARNLARRLGLPLLPALELKPRLSHTHQAKLSLGMRLQSPSKFRVREFATPLLPGSTLLLVDDFFTTGRTLKSAAAELRSAGAAEIHGYCLGVRPALRRGEDAHPVPAA